MRGVTATEEGIRSRSFPAHHYPIRFNPGRVIVANLPEMYLSIAPVLMMVMPYLTHSVLGSAYIAGHDGWTGISSRL